MEYDANGQMTSRTEADGDMTLARTTEWTYDPTYPALPATMLQPSVAGGLAQREVAWSYDADGNPTSRTISGMEAGSAFSYPTVTTYNAAGQPTDHRPGPGTAPTT